VRDTFPLSVAAVAYAALTVVMFWPLAADLRTGIPHDVGDPLLNTWLLWWNSQAVPFTEKWWNGPIFWPLPDALTLSEHLVGVSTLSTPLHWLGANPQAVYNIVLLLSWPLSAVAAHALCYRLTGSHAAGAVGGLIFGFNPYRLGQIPHIQVLVSWWMPLTFLALHRIVETGSLRLALPWVVVFILSWLLQALSNGYFLFYFSLLVAFWFLWFLARPGSSKLGAKLLLLWGLAGLSLFPILLRYRATHERWSLSRDFGTVMQYSADLPSFFTAASLVRLWPFRPDVRPEQGLYPGIVALLLVLGGVITAVVSAPSRSQRKRRASLAVLGLAIVFFISATITLVAGPWILDFGFIEITGRQARKPLTLALGLAFLAMLVDSSFRDVFRRRSLLAFYVSAAALSLLMCLGPNGRLMGEQIIEKPPYWWLLKIPGAAALRVPTRFMMVGTLPLAVAAALSFRLITRKLPAKAGRAAVATCLIALVADSWPLRLPMHLPREAYTVPPAVGDAAIIELPLGETTDDEVAAMVRSMKHGRAVVNGYSGHFPPPYLVLRKALQERDGPALLGLASFGRICVVIDRRRLMARNSRVMTESLGAPLIGVDGEYSFYLIDKQPSPARHGEQGLPIRRVTAADRPEEIPAVHDGSTSSVWESTTWQRGQEALTVELQEADQVGGISLAQGQRVGDYPRRLAIDLSMDGLVWSTAWEGPTAGLAFVASVVDHKEAWWSIRFPANFGRYVRLRQTGSAMEVYWAVAELQVHR